MQQENKISPDQKTTGQTSVNASTTVDSGYVTTGPTGSKLASRLIFGIVFLGLSGLAGWLLLTDATPDSRRGFGGGGVTVMVEPVSKRQFADIVEALGTVVARESVQIAAPVTDIVAGVHFEDGDRVKAGQLLVSLEADEERALVTEASGNVREAEANFERIEGLVQRGNSTTAALDEARRRLAEVRSRLAAAEARLRDREIRAPFDGLLGLRGVSAGSLVTQNTPITTLDAVDTVKLDFSVPERFIPALGRGQTLEAHAGAYPGETFFGRVVTIDSRVDPQTRSVTVRADVPNQDLRLRPGMLMVVEVTSRTWEAFAVAEESVVPAAGKDYVFVVKGKDVERREVTLGLRRPGYVEVLEGLENGEKVVTEGVHRLGRQGIKVRVLNDQVGTRMAEEDEIPNVKGR